MKPVIYFDGVCNLCNGFVQFIIDHDPEAYFQFTSLQSDKGQEMAKELGIKTGAFDTVVYQEGKQIFTKSEAVLRIAKHLDGWKWMAVFYVLPLPLCNFFYDIIARNRYRWFGKNTTCRLPSADTQRRFL